VWVDEYRHGARRDTREAFDQILRDAWDGHVAVKGGLGNNPQALTTLAATAPLLVTGEDSFSETSHAERMVVLDLPKQGRDPEALRQLRQAETAGLGRAYLEWLLWMMEREELEAPPDVTTDRQSHSLAVVRWGWAQLRIFAVMVGGYEIPPFDASLVEAGREEEESPYIEALRESLDKYDRHESSIAWIDGADVIVRVPSLVVFAKELGIVLPGGHRAARNWLRATYAGSSDERTHFGRGLRLPGAAGQVQ